MTSSTLEAHVARTGIIMSMMQLEIKNSVLDGAAV